MRICTSTHGKQDNNLASWGNIFSVSLNYNIPLNRTYGPRTAKIKLTNCSKLPYLNDARTRKLDIGCTGQTGRSARAGGIFTYESAMKGGDDDVACNF